MECEMPQQHTNGLIFFFKYILIHLKKKCVCGKYFQDCYDIVNKTINNAFVKVAFAQQAAMLAEPVSLVSLAGAQESSSTTRLRQRSRLVGAAGRAAPLPTTLHQSPYLPCKEWKCSLRRDFVFVKMVTGNGWKAQKI